MAVHAMIDLETLGTKPDCQVLTLGAIKFDPNTLEEGFDPVHFRFDVDIQQADGRTVEEDTLEWWMKQDKEVIEAAFTPDGRQPPIEVLQQLRKWLVGVDTIWAQGVTFDIVILENMYRMYNESVPWPFWKIKDSRTLLGIMPTDPRKNYTFAAHDALEDAKIQAKCVQETLAKLELKIR